MYVGNGWPAVHIIQPLSLKNCLQIFPIDECQFLTVPLLVFDISHQVFIVWQKSALSHCFHRKFPPLAMQTKASSCVCYDRSPNYNRSLRVITRGCPPTWPTLKIDCTTAYALYLSVMYDVCMYRSVRILL